MDQQGGLMWVTASPYLSSHVQRDGRVIRVNTGPTTLQRKRASGTLRLHQHCRDRGKRTSRSGSHGHFDSVLFTRAEYCSYVRCEPGLPTV